MSESNNFFCNYNLHINPIQKCLFILPGNLYGPLTFRMHCHWSIDHHMALQSFAVLRGVPKFFQFHAFYGKFWQNHVLSPPCTVGPHVGEILDPPLAIDHSSIG